MDAISHEKSFEVFLHFVIKAFVHQRVRLKKNEVAEEYLATLLDRAIATEASAQTSIFRPLPEEFSLLTHMPNEEVEEVLVSRHRQMVNIAETALFISGMFPGAIRHFMIPPGAYLRLSQLAYEFLFRRDPIRETDFQSIYETFAKNIVLPTAILREVGNEIRQPPKHIPGQIILN